MRLAALVGVIAVTSGCADLPATMDDIADQGREFLSQHTAFGYAADALRTKRLRFTVSCGPERYCAMVRPFSGEKHEPRLEQRARDPK